MRFGKPEVSITTFGHTRYSEKRRQILPPITLSDTLDRNLAISSKDVAMVTRVGATAPGSRVKTGRQNYYF